VAAKEQATAASPRSVTNTLFYSQMQRLYMGKAAKK